MKKNEFIFCGHFNLALLVGNSRKKYEKAKYSFRFSHTINYTWTHISSILVSDMPQK